MKQINFDLNRLPIDPPNEEELESQEYNLKLENKLDRFQASTFLSAYYEVLFPSFIASLVLSLFFGDLIISSILGKTPVDLTDGLTVSESAQYANHLALASGLLSAIFLLFFSDNEMKKSNLNYNRPKDKLSNPISLIYALSCLGIFFFLATLLGLLFGLFGENFISNAESGQIGPDYILIQAGRILRLDPSLVAEMALLSFFLYFDLYWD